MWAELKSGMTSRSYTDTEQGHPGFTLYPKRTSDLLMNTNYIMHFNQYEDASETITVNVYFDDEVVGHEEFSIADHRNKDRMDHLGLQSKPLELPPWSTTLSVAFPE